VLLFLCEGFYVREAGIVLNCLNIVYHLVDLCMIFALELFVNSWRRLRLGVLYYVLVLHFFSFSGVFWVLTDLIIIGDMCKFEGCFLYLRVIIVAFDGVSKVL